MADDRAVVADGASTAAPITTETTATEAVASAAVETTTTVTTTTTTSMTVVEVGAETSVVAASASSADVTAEKDEDAAAEATEESTAAVEQSMKIEQDADATEKRETPIEQEGDAAAKQPDSSAAVVTSKDESAADVVAVAPARDAKDVATSVAMKVGNEASGKSDAVDEKLEKKEKGSDANATTSVDAPVQLETAVERESATAGKRKEIEPPTADVTASDASSNAQEASSKKQKTEPIDTVKAETPAPQAPVAQTVAPAAPSTQQQSQGASKKAAEASVAPAAPIMISRDDMAKMEEDDGLVKFDVITNDGTPEHMIQLTTLKNIFAKQLPKMPKEYIVRLVFDRNHRSMVILKNGTHVIGGICYRPFLPNHFAEIAFCAINAADQVKGYGTRLMNHLKEFVKREGITHFLTYADNYAIGYFKKQGFAKVVSMPRPNWFGYIKDYDGGTLMECTIHYQIDYLRITSMVHKQRKAIQDKIKERSRAHIVYPGLEKFAEGRLMDIYMIPGVKEAGWSQATIRNSRIGTRDPGSLKTQLTQLWKAVSSHRSAWPFHEPVDTTIVVDYLEYIKDPVDLSLIAKRIESGQYISKAALRADLDKMIENCTMYNTPDTNYYKAAKDLQEFIERRIQIRDPSKQNVARRSLERQHAPRHFQHEATYHHRKELLKSSSMSSVESAVRTGSAESLSNANDNGVNLEEIDFDELDDYLELFQQDGIIKEALSKGVDLRQYAQQIDQELRAAEIDSVSQYVMKSEDIVELHDQVQECDNILAKMQEMLLGFQADLGGISDEIRHLQDESIGMNVRLKNRRETEDQLKRYLDQVALAPSLVTTVDDAEVNDAYLHALVTLNGKLKYAALREPDPAGSSFDLIPSQTAAFREVESQLQKLKAHAVTRVREFLLGKMNEVKKPKTNVQMVQQNTLLPMKYLVTFLTDNAPEVEEEFREVYAEAMSKTLTTVFKSYHTGLMKFYEEVATRTDLIAIEEQSLKGIFSSRVNLTKRNDTFSIGDREKILEAAAAPPLILHVAQQENHKLPYEAIFRNVQQHLMNSATSEYLFLIDFFKPSFGDNPLRSRDLFLRVFAKTLSSCLENLENYLFTCYDAVGLLLMIRLTYAQRLVMEKRRIPVLDSYFDRVTLLLWPRFKAVFDLNLLSVKNAKVKKLGAIDLHPHYVIRRYAEFAASVLSLSMYTQQQSGSDEIAISSAQMHENGAGDMVLNNLAVLRDEILSLLVRLAEQHKNLKDKCVFLVNNYDLVLSLFQERRIISEETSKLEELLAEQRERFVEEELLTWYAKLIQFVRHNESLTLGKSGGGLNKDTSASNGPHEVDTAQIEKIVREFASTWKSGIEKINGNIMKYFSNFRNGMEILKQVLTQLLLYYTRFIEIVKKSYQRPPPFGNDIVTTQEILYEIKKYSRSF